MLLEERHYEKRNWLKKNRRCTHRKGEEEQEESDCVGKTVLRGRSDREVGKPEKTE